MSIPYKTPHFSVLVTVGQRDEGIQAQILIISVLLYKDPIFWKLKAQVFLTNASCTISTDLSCLFLDLSYHTPLKRWNINCQGSRMVLPEQCKLRRLHGLALRLNRTAALTAQKTLKIKTSSPLAGKAHKHNSCRRQEKDSLLFQVPEQK